METPKPHYVLSASHLVPTIALLAALLLCTASCDGYLPRPNDDDSDDDLQLGPCEPMATSITIGTAERPAELKGPPGWCSNWPMQVIVLLHGYGATADAQEFLFRLSDRIEPDDFLLVLPNGTADVTGRRFWNGPPGCCDFYGSGVDDVGYLTSLIDDIEDIAMIAPNGVYFVGHSNGGFMSYRMACEKPELVSAIASLAGSGYPQASDCASDVPTSVLQIHGEDDSTIPYAGEQWYPGAVDLVERWANRAGCDLNAGTAGDSLDLVDSLSGPETDVFTYSDGCINDTEVSLWTINDGPHTPYVNDNFGEQVVQWLLRH